MIAKGLLKKPKAKKKAIAKKVKVKDSRNVAAETRALDIANKDSKLPVSAEKAIVSHLLEEWNVDPLRIMADIAMNGENDTVRLKAATELADRDGKYLKQKAVEQVEHRGKFEFNINVQGVYADDENEVVDI